MTARVDIDGLAALLAEKLRTHAAMRAERYAPSEVFDPLSDASAAADAACDSAVAVNIGPLLDEVRELRVLADACARLDADGYYRLERWPSHGQPLTLCALPRGHRPLTLAALLVVLAAEVRS